MKQTYAKWEETGNGHPNLRPEDRTNHGHHQEQRGQQRGMAVADVDVVACRSIVRVGGIEASVVYPDVAPEGGAQYICHPHGAENDYNRRPGLQTKHERKVRNAGEGGGEANMKQNLLTNIYINEVK